MHDILKHIHFWNLIIARLPGGEERRMIFDVIRCCNVLGQCLIRQGSTVYKDQKTKKKDDEPNWDCLLFSD